MRFKQQWGLVQPRSYHDVCADCDRQQPGVQQTTVLRRGAQMRSHPQYSMVWLRCSNPKWRDRRRQWEGIHPAAVLRGGAALQS